MSYNRTSWVDGKTPLSAENMNNLEFGIADLYTKSEKVENRKNSIDDSQVGGEYPTCSAVRVYVDSYVSDSLSGFQQTVDRDSSISQSPSQSHYPSTVAVKSYVDEKVRELEQVGDLEDLKTENKDTVVNAINELHDNISDMVESINTTLASVIGIRESSLLNALSSALYGDEI